MNKQINISVLNLVPVREGKNATGAFEDMITLAKHVDNSDYQRYWISEHHNMRSIASSATRQLIQHVLQNTETIRAGSGGVMLPNHSPYIVAEEFGTLHAIFGDRLDIGLGRAPGTDMMTANAIRRSNHEGVFSFRDEIEELRRYLDDNKTSLVAYPGEGTKVPLYVLGSSTDSAHIAAKLGLPYAFAAHFAPQQMREAFIIYENNFKPSEQLAEPYKMASVNAVLADSNMEAEYLATTHYQNIIGLLRNTRNQLPKPVDSMDGLWTPSEEHTIKNQFPIQFFGTKDDALQSLENFQEKFSVDELLVNSYVYDMDALLKTYDIFADVAKTYNES